MPNNTQILAMAQEAPTAFSRAVLQRFMTDREIDLFNKRYQENKKKEWNKNRFQHLRAVVTQAEKDLVKEYFTNESLTADELAASLGISEPILIYRVKDIATRMQYQQGL